MRGGKRWPQARNYESGSTIEWSDGRSFAGDIARSSVRTGLRGSQSSRLESAATSLCCTALTMSFTTAQSSCATIWWIEEPVGVRRGRPDQGKPDARLDEKTALRNGSPVRDPCRGAIPARLHRECSSPTVNEHRR